MTLLHPAENQLGTDITGFLPREDQVLGLIAFRAGDDLVWRRAVNHLNVRSNDGHTAFSYGLASAGHHTIEMTLEIDGSRQIQGKRHPHGKPRFIHSG